MTQAQPRPRTRKIGRRSETFDDRIAVLTDELLLALQWNRPSILFAVCASTTAEGRARQALGAEIEAQGYRCTDYRVRDSESADIPARLSMKRNRDKRVFFIKGLEAGGASALRCLNIRREYFVDKQLHVVFWLTPEEEAQVARHAPDFWAFRHRVVYFPDEP